MAVSIPFWLNTLSGLFREKPVRLPLVESNAAMTRIIVDLVCADDIELMLEKSLTYLQRYIDGQLDADIYVTGLPAPHRHKLLHAASVSAPAGLAGQLNYQLNEHLISDADELRYKLPGIPLTVYAKQLRYNDQSQPAWLILCFRDSLPGNQQINRITAPIADALNTGLSGWHQQQLRISDAISSEKAAHAAELHDSMAQILGYMKIKASRLADKCHRQAIPELAEISMDLSQQASCAYRQTRELISCSRLSIEQGQLIEAINQAVDEFEERSSIVFELDNRIGKQCCTHDDTQTIFIIREALNNIVRHSHATHARVLLKRVDGNLIHIRVEDNGKGIRSDQARQDSFGMKIMQERAERIGGNLSILPRHQGGTRVDLQVREVK